MLNPREELTKLLGTIELNQENKRIHVMGEDKATNYVNGQLLISAGELVRCSFGSFVNRDALISLAESKIEGVYSFLYKKL